MTIKCIFCNGFIEVDNSNSICTCPYCGLTQSVKINSIASMGSSLDDSVEYLDAAGKCLLMGFFSKAKEFYNMALKENSKSVEVFLGLFLSENECHNINEAISKCPEKIGNSANFSLAIDYSTEPFKSKLSEIRNQSINTSKELIYKECVKLENKLLSYHAESDDIAPLIDKYIILGNFKDSYTKVCFWITTYILNAKKYMEFKNALSYLEYVYSFFCDYYNQNKEENSKLFIELQNIVLSNLGYTFYPNDLLTIIEFSNAFEKFELSIDKYVKNRETLKIFEPIILENIDQGIQNISKFIDDELPIIINDLKKYSFLVDELRKTIGYVINICTEFNRKDLSDKFCSIANKALEKENIRETTKAKAASSFSTLKGVLVIVLILACLLLPMILMLIFS